MRLLLGAISVACASASFAQMPDVQFKADIGPTYWAEEGTESEVRWYDPFGHHSVIGLQFALEPGFRAYVTQRIQRIRNDGDESQVDESYVEDAGVWRAGKQYLPFGPQSIFRESVTAIRSDTELFLRVLPMSVAACDGGKGRQRGFVGRIGTRFGVSFALGQHFGISGTSLTQVRPPEASSGRGGGYREVFGADYSKAQGPMTFRGEFVMFRRGHLGAHDLRVLEVSASYEPRSDRSLTLAYAVGNEDDQYSLRLVGKVRLGENVWLEPWIRTRGGSATDGGITARVRL